MDATLVQEMRFRLEEPLAGSFRLMGEALALISGPALEAAASSYRTRLNKSVPEALRLEFAQEQTSLATSAHRWLRKYNANLHSRVRGYLALGRLFSFEYPWPVVAVLGVSQVLEGIKRGRLWGLAGAVGSRFGADVLERTSDGLDDTLRRTNRGIFADSVPTVLYAWRCVELRRAGRQSLSNALIDGPLPPTFDETSRTLIAEFVSAFDEADEVRRFRRLADLTLTHFHREQEIFTHHMGAHVDRLPKLPRKWLARRMVAPAAVPAPKIVLKRGYKRLTFEPYKLPQGFDMRDHKARLEHFGCAFVTSITKCHDDYRVVRNYVVERFGRPQNRG